MLKNTNLVVLLLCISGSVFGQYPSKPFPQHVEYAGNYIQPSKYSQSELDELVIGFYNQWKEKYVKNGCGVNKYYIDFDSGNTLSVSEAMGYGMIILPLMAGHDSDAKIIFDGLFQFCKDYPSEINSDLMAWRVIKGCTDDGAPTAASDGDIDIAYGLLLADIQWGSHHEINYYAEAEKLISAIFKDEINQSTKTVKLGDWASSSSSSCSTRPSDFILDHFRIFECVTENPVWSDVVDSCYSLIKQMQDNFSPVTGLIPDFIVDVNGSAKPASTNFLEGDYDGHYYYNSCRVPWRVSTDYLLNGDELGRVAINKLNQWLRNKTLNSPDNITSGYLLDGTAFTDYYDNAFIAPFAVGAMLGTENQNWLDLIFENVVQTSIYDEDYYSNTLKMLALIVISGNYWNPDCDVLHVGDVDKSDAKMFYAIKQDNYLVVKLFPEAPGSSYKAILYRINGSQSNVFTINNSFHKRDVSSLPGGCYILKIKNLNTKQTETQKIMF